MNYQEAIEAHIYECRHRIDVIRNYMNTNADADKDGCCENIQVLETAISAMQELKMYEDSKLCLIPEDVYGKQCEELDRYKELGTLEEVRDAVEKQKKKIPIEDRHHGIRYTEVYRCHSCNGSFPGRGFAKYCYHCGQAIDWSEVDE